MKIKVLEIGDIEWEKRGKAKWQSIELTYDSEQGKKSRKFVSFNDIFNDVKKVEIGAEYDVEIKKDDQGYWNWVSISPASSEAAKMEKAVSGKAAQSGNTWDEKNKLDRERFEFEKEKQLLIIRQSCLSSAVEASNLRGEKAPFYTNLAEEFVDYVLHGPTKKSPGRPKKEVVDSEVEEVDVN